jgi:hypothetical protein
MAMTLAFEELLIVARAQGSEKLTNSGGPDTQTTPNTKVVRFLNTNHRDILAGFESIAAVETLEAPRPPRSPPRCRPFTLPASRIWVL